MTQEERLDKMGITAYTSREKELLVEIRRLESENHYLQAKTDDDMKLLKRATDAMYEAAQVIMQLKTELAQRDGLVVETKGYN